MNATGYLEFLIVSALSLVLGVGVPMPISIPPLPEEPALLRIAPKDSFVFVSWSGSAPASPKSTNRTERLAAEPEVRAMFEEMRTAALQMLNRQAGPEMGLALRTLDFATTTFQHPGCFFVSDIEFRSKLDGGLAVKLGDRMTSAKAIMGALELAFAGMLRNGAPQHEDLEVGDVTFRAMPIPADKLFLGWAVVDDWFLLASGKKVPEQMLAGLRGETQGIQENPSFHALQTQTAVAQTSTRTFLDLERVYDILRSRNATQPLALAQLLGLGQATAMFSTTGLEGDGYCYRVQFTAPEHTGLLGAFAGGPLRQDDLMRIPSDANLALSCRIDVPALEQALIELSSMGAPAAGHNAYEDEWLGAFAEAMGVDWRDDLLAHLGDQLTLWNAPSQGGALFTGAAGTLSLKDPEAFANSMNRLGRRLAEMGPSKEQLIAQNGAFRRHSAAVETFDCSGHKAMWLDVFDDDFLIAPSWTTTKSHLVAGMTPQSLRATVGQDGPPNPDQSLLRHARYNRRGNASGMLHIDMHNVVETGYPALLMFVQSMGLEWQREGFDFDLANMPRLDALLPHLGRELTLLEPNDTGWAIRREGSMPAIDPAMFIVLLSALATFS